jgi:hypothetical protein
LFDSALGHCDSNTIRGVNISINDKPPCL